MTAVVIVVVVLFCGAIGLLVWNPALTSRGIRPESKRQQGARSSGQRAPR